jgi:hypothetical protein
MQVDALVPIERLAHLRSSIQLQNLEKKKNAGKTTKSSKVFTRVGSSDFWVTQLMCFGGEYESPYAQIHSP